MLEFSKADEFAMRPCRWWRREALWKADIELTQTDLAEFMVDACEPTIWVGKAVQLGG